jgi:hypothetical protein
LVAEDPPLESYRKTAVSVDSRVHRQCKRTPNMIYSRTLRDLTVPALGLGCMGMRREGIS